MFNDPSKVQQSVSICANPWQNTNPRNLQKLVTRVLVKTLE